MEMKKGAELNGRCKTYWLHLFLKKSLFRKSFNAWLPARAQVEARACTTQLAVSIRIHVKCAKLNESGRLNRPQATSAGLDGLDHALPMASLKSLWLVVGAVTFVMIYDVLNDVSS
jgi:hypothetical protein